MESAVRAGKSALSGKAFMSANTTDDRHVKDETARTRRNTAKNDVEVEEEEGEQVDESDEDEAERDETNTQESAVDKVAGGCSPGDDVKTDRGRKSCRTEQVVEDESEGSVAMASESDDDEDGGSKSQRPEEREAKGNTEVDAGEPTYDEKQEKAAIKIQAGARGKRDRGRVKEMKVGGKGEAGGDIVDGDGGEAKASMPETGGRRYDEKQEKAASKIQAGARGKRDRGRVKEMKVGGKDVGQ